MPRRDAEEEGPNALDLADQAALELREGRYSAVVGDRPSWLDTAWKRLTLGARWHDHLRGHACKECGLTAHEKRFARIHNRWHSWLDNMFGQIGDDIDNIEGELADLRARIADADRRAELAAEQVAVITRALGPALAQVLEVNGDGSGLPLICQCEPFESGKPCPHCGMAGGPTHWDVCHKIEAGEA